MQAPSRDECLGSLFTHHPAVEGPKRWNQGFLCQNRWQHIIKHHHTAKQPAFSVPVTSLGTKNKKVFSFLPPYPIPSTTEHTKLKVLQKRQAVCFPALALLLTGQQPSLPEENIQESWSWSRKVSKKRWKRQYIWNICLFWFLQIDTLLPMSEKMIFLPNSHFLLWESYGEQSLTPCGDDHRDLTSKTQVPCSATPHRETSVLTPPHQFAHLIHPHISVSSAAILRPRQTCSSNKYIWLHRSLHLQRVSVEFFP